MKYGPVQAADLADYLETGEASPEMRRVRFALPDRIVLIPVELVHVLLPALVAAVVAFFVGGLLASGAIVAAVLAGAVLFPVLLPWLPTGDFSSKGFILGGLVALPFAVAALLMHLDAPWWLRVAEALTLLLSVPPVTAFLALNFTGSTTFTSRSGVRREMFKYIPIMAWSFGIGIALTIAVSLVQAMGG